MSSSTYFTQGCPTCGRWLQIRVEYLGKRVVCQHCKARFLACDPASRHGEQLAQQSTLLQRVDELLETVALRQKQQIRSPHPR